MTEETHEPSPVLVAARARLAEWVERNPELARQLDEAARELLDEDDADLVP